MDQGQILSSITHLQEGLFLETICFSYLQEEHEGESNDGKIWSVLELWHGHNYVIVIRLWGLPRNWDAISDKEKVQWEVYSDGVYP